MAYPEDKQKRNEVEVIGDVYCFCLIIALPYTTKFIAVKPHSHAGMEKEIITVYIIAGTALIAAILAGAFEWFFGTKKENSPGSRINTANGDGNIVGSKAGVDRNNELKTVVLDKNIRAAKNKPEFLRIVWNMCKKTFDELTDGEIVTLWDDVLKALERAEEAEKNFEIVKQGVVGVELKALLPKIEYARDGFDYDTVNRLLEGFQENHKLLRQDLARVDFLQGQNYELQINNVNADRYYRKAAAIDDENSLYLNAHGRRLFTSGRYAEAEPLYRRALGIREKSLGKEHPDVVTDLNNLAGLLKTQGKYAEAEPLFRRTLAMKEKALGMEHPDVANDLNNLAELLRTQGKYDEAEPLFRRALAIREKRLDPAHPDVAQSMNNLAGLLKTQGKYNEAAPLYRRALAIKEKTLGMEHPDVATSLNNLAILLKMQRKYDEAEPLFRRALAILEKSFGMEHLLVAMSLNNLGELLQAQGNDKAEPFYRQALAIREKTLGKEHPNTVTCRDNLNALLENKR
jgi:tetratricopeptide (TPR) repeat protein